MEEEKREMLQCQINCFVDNVLMLADREGKLDHLEIDKIAREEAFDNIDWGWKVEE